MTEEETLKEFMDWCNEMKEFKLPEITSEDELKISFIIEHYKLKYSKDECQCDENPV